MIDLSFLILGALATAVPLLTVWLTNRFQQTIVKCESIKNDLDVILEDLNKLHNSAVGKYSGIDGRILKIETELQASKYGKTIR